MKKNLLFIVSLIILYGCTENIDKSARYVFTDCTIVDYLQGHEQYSDYLRLLEKTPVSRLSQSTLRQLLTARGHYTVFAPTNEAIQLYLDSMWRKGIIDQPSWDGFRSDRERDSVEQVIAYNSILDGGDNTLIYTSDFPVEQDGEIFLPNMLDRHLIVHQSEDSVGHFLVNDQPMDIRNRDIPLINGVLHAMNGVVAPSNNTLGRLLFNTRAARGILRIGTAGPDSWPIGHPRPMARPRL